MYGRKAGSYITVLGWLALLKGLSIAFLARDDEGRSKK